MIVTSIHVYFISIWRPQDSGCLVQGCFSLNTISLKCATLRPKSFSAQGSKQWLKQPQDLLMMLIHGTARCVSHIWNWVWVSGLRQPLPQPGPSPAFICDVILPTVAYKSTWPCIFLDNTAADVTWAGLTDSLYTDFPISPVLSNLRTPWRVSVLLTDTCVFAALPSSDCKTRKTTTQTLIWDDIFKTSSQWQTEAQRPKWEVTLQRWSHTLLFSLGFLTLSFCLKSQQSPGLPGLWLAWAINKHHINNILFSGLSDRSREGGLDSVVLWSWVQLLIKSSSKTQFNSHHDLLAACLSPHFPPKRMLKALMSFPRPYKRGQCLRSRKKRGKCRRR